MEAEKKKEIADKLCEADNLTLVQLQSPDCSAGDRAHLSEARICLQRAMQEILSAG